MPQNKGKTGDGSNPTTLTLRQQLQRRTELEELRKFGLAPLATDAVSGQEISPNVPFHLAQAPWFYGIDGSTLEHHRKTTADDAQFNDAVDSAKRAGKAETYVVGACQNCGSRTHKTKECLRPKRRAGAAVTGRVEGDDVIVTTVSEKSFEQKRDLWAGGSNSERSDDLWRMHEKKRAREEEEAAQQQQQQQDTEADSPGSKRRAQLSQSFRDESGSQFQGTEQHQLPKYLENLETSAFYDPITRSMRANPFGETGSADSTFRGDNARYASGGHREFLTQQRRFLSGESKSIVDFEYDLQVQEQRRLKEEQQQLLASSGGTHADTLKQQEQGEDLAALLYSSSGTAVVGHSSALLTVEAAATSVMDKSDEPANVAPTVLPSSSGVVVAPSDDSTSTPSSNPDPPSIQAHAAVFGSYFDVATKSWGYKCCRSTDRYQSVCQPYDGEKDLK